MKHILLYCILIAFFSSCRMHDFTSIKSSGDLVLELYDLNKFALYKKGTNPKSTLPIYSSLGVFTLQDSNIVLIPESFFRNGFRIKISNKYSKTGHVNFYSNKKDLPYYLVLNDTILKISVTKQKIDSKYLGQVQICKSNSPVVSMNLRDSTDYFFNFVDIGVRSTLINEPVYGVI